MRVWIAGLFLLTSFLASCDTTEDASYWISKLDNPDREAEAVRNLKKLGDPAAIPALAKKFEQKRHPDILRAIASFKDKEGFDKAAAMPALISALDFNENDYNNATIAAEALGSLNAQEAVDPLVGVLDKKISVRSRANLAKQAAIQALETLRSPRSVDGLIRTLERPPEEQDFLLAKKAAQALGVIGAAKAAPALLHGLFRASTAHAPMYVEARVALVRIGEPAIEAMLTAYRGKDKVLNGLAKELEFRPGIVQHKVALVLGDMVAKSATPDLVKVLRGKQVGDNHRGTIYALGRIGSEETLGQLLWAVENHPDWNMKVAAAEALNIHGSMKALPTLLKLAESGFIVKGGEKYNELRWATAMAYSRLAGPEGYQKLEPIVEAATPEQGRGIFDEALKRLEVSRDCQGDAACYAKALNDKELVKQESAAFHLARLDSAKDQLPALNAKLKTKEAVIRLAVLYALDRIGDQSSVQALEAQITRDKGKSAKALGADLVNEMRCTVARIGQR